MLIGTGRAVNCCNDEVWASLLVSAAAASLAFFETTFQRSRQCLVHCRQSLLRYSLQRYNNKLSIDWLHV